MGTAVDGIFHAVGKLTNAVRPNHLAISEMQIGRLGRIVDLERKSKLNLRFFGRSYHPASDYELPLPNRLHGRLKKKWITGNGLQLSNGIVFSNNQDKFHFPFDAREPSLSGVSGAYSICGKAAQLVLRDLTARVRRRALGSRLRKKNREQKTKKGLSEWRDRRHEALIASGNEPGTMIEDDGLQTVTRPLDGWTKGMPSPDKSHYRTSAEPGLHLSGTRVYQACGLLQRSRLHRTNPAVED